MRSLALLLAGAATACTSLLGVDFEGRLAPASTAEGGTDGGSTSNVDGGGGGGSEAAADAGTPVDASSVACDATFCSDFDPALDDPPWGWTSMTGTPSKDFGIDTAASTTGPSSLHLLARVGVQTVNRLGLDLTPGGVSRWELDLRIAQVPGTLTTPASLFELRCPSGDLAVVLQPNRRLVLGHGSIDIAITDPISLDTWRHVAIGLAVGSTSLTVEGVSPVSIAYDCTGATHASLEIVSAVDPADSAPYEIFIDRVRLIR